MPAIKSNLSQLMNTQLTGIILLNTYLRVQKVLKAVLKRHSKGRCLFPRTKHRMQTAFQESVFSFFFLLFVCFLNKITLIKYCSTIPYMQEWSKFFRKLGKSSDVLWVVVYISIYSCALWEALVGAAGLHHSSAFHGKDLNEQSLPKTCE